MKRRKFLAFFVGAAATPLIKVSGQQSTQPVVGFLVTGTPASHGSWVAACVQRLSELGWKDGHTVRIEYRWAAGDPQKLTEFAAEFAQRKVNVIVTSANGTMAAKQATTSIPIVFAAFGDPVALGVVTSLARPGGKLNRPDRSAQRP